MPISTVNTSISVVFILVSVLGEVAAPARAVITAGTTIAAVAK